MPVSKKTLKFLKIAKNYHYLITTIPEEEAIEECYDFKRELIDFLEKLKTEKNTEEIRIINNLIEIQNAKIVALSNSDSRLITEARTKEIDLIDKILTPEKIKELHLYGPRLVNKETGISFSEILGVRYNLQQDAAFVGSLDKKIEAVQNPENFFKTTIKNIVEKHNEYYQGTTLCSAIVNPYKLGGIIEKFSITTANLGDSRASVIVKYSEDSETKYGSTSLTYDHSLDREYVKKCIEEKGGSIVSGRVNKRGINMGASIGDKSTWSLNGRKKNCLITDPDIIKYNLDKICSDLGIEKESVIDVDLVVACDGIFDVMGDDAKFPDIHRSSHTISYAKSVFDSLEVEKRNIYKSFSDYLVQRAYEIGSTDNISAIHIPIIQNGKLKVTEPIIATVCDGHGGSYLEDVNEFLNPNKVLDKEKADGSLVSASVAADLYAAARVQTIPGLEINKEHQEPLFGLIENLLEKSIGDDITNSDSPFTTHPSESSIPPPPPPPPSKSGDFPTSPPIAKDSIVKREPEVQQENLIKKLIRYQLQEIRKERDPELRAYKIKTLRNLVICHEGSDAKKKLPIGARHEDASEFVLPLFDALYDTMPVMLESRLTGTDGTTQYNSNKFDPSVVITTSLTDKPKVDAGGFFSFFSTTKTSGCTKTIRETLESFQNPEPLTQGNYVNFKTSRGSRKLPTTKQLKVFVADDASEIIVSTKRFEFYQNRSSGKIDTPVSLDNIDLSVSRTGEVKTFEPTAFIRHYGNLVKGHYTAYVKESDNNWYCYNDENRSGPIDEKTLKQEQDLSYVIKYSSSGTPLPEAQSGSNNLTGNMCWANSATVFAGSFTSLAQQEIQLTDAEREILTADLARDSRQSDQVSKDLGELKSHIARVTGIEITDAIIEIADEEYFSSTKMTPPRRSTSTTQKKPQSSSTPEYLSSQTSDHLPQHIKATIKRKGTLIGSELESEVKITTRNILNRCSDGMEKGKFNKYKVNNPWKHNETDEEFTERRTRQANQLREFSAESDIFCLQECSGEDAQEFIRELKESRTDGKEFIFVNFPSNGDPNDKSKSNITIYNQNRFGLIETSPSLFSENHNRAGGMFCGLSTTFEDNESGQNFLVENAHAPFNSKSLIEDNIRGLTIFNIPIISVGDFNTDSKEFVGEDIVTISSDKPTNFDAPSVDKRGIDAEMTIENRSFDMAHILLPENFSAVVNLTANSFGKDLRVEEEVKKFTVNDEKLSDPIGASDKIGEELKKKLEYIAAGKESGKISVTKNLFGEKELPVINPELFSLSKKLGQKTWYAEFGGIVFEEKEGGEKIFNDADLFMASFRGCHFQNVDFSKVGSFGNIGFHKCTFDGCAFPEKSIEAGLFGLEEGKLIETITNKLPSSSPKPLEVIRVNSVDKTHDLFGGQGDGGY